MFVRWKKAQEPKWLKRDVPPGVVRWRAYLVRAIRIDGKPRQEQIYLGAYTTYDPDLRDMLQHKTRLSLSENEYERRHRFWRRVYDKLYEMRMSSDDVKQIVQRLSERIRVLPPDVPYWGDLFT